MALLDFLKKKKKKPEKTQKEARPLKVHEAEVKEETKEFKPTPTRKRREGVEDIAWKILKKPHVTEKATALADQNQYTFDIWPKANKVEVKKAVESAYGVDVVSVRIIQGRQKLRRRGRIEGFKRGDKKAVVRLREGEKIEVLPR